VFRLRNASAWPSGAKAANTSNWGDAGEVSCLISPVFTESRSRPRDCPGEERLEITSHCESGDQSRQSTYPPSVVLARICNAALPSLFSNPVRTGTT
jgi:hypothetical protein